MWHMSILFSLKDFIESTLYKLKKNPEQTWFIPINYTSPPPFNLERNKSQSVASVATWQLPIKSRWVELGGDFALIIRILFDLTLINLHKLHLRSSYHVTWVAIAPLRKLFDD